VLHKKVYNRIAEILRESGSKEQIAERLADYFSEDNPRFVRSKFMSAVKLKEAVS
jgi:hypothetical protein